MIIYYITNKISSLNINHHRLPLSIVDLLKEATPIDKLNTAEYLCNLMLSTKTEKRCYNQKGQDELKSDNSPYNIKINMRMYNNYRTWNSV